MKHALTIASLGMTLALAGCVQRTITVNSIPEGALVYLNDEEVGRTPVTVPFTFYGTYDVRLEKEDFQTINTKTRTDAPWWETPGPDLFAEMLPGTRRVNLKWDYTLVPAGEVDNQELIDRAKGLRQSLNSGGPVVPAR